MIGSVTSYLNGIWRQGEERPQGQSSADVSQYRHSTWSAGNNGLGTGD